MKLDSSRARWIPLGVALVLTIAAAVVGSMSVGSVRPNAASTPREARAVEAIVRAAEPERARSASVTPALGADEQVAPGAKPPSGRLTLLARWAGGAPAAGIAVRLAGPTGIRTTASDRAGRATATLAAGAWKATTIGASVSFQIDADAESEVVLELPSGRPLAGVVVDRDDRPVPGAEVWLDDSWDGWSPTVARTDALGRFRIASASGALFVGARAGGYAPSPIEPLPPDGDDELRLRLVLPAVGGQVRGTVRSSTRRPVAGAQLELRPFTVPFVGAKAPSGPTRRVATDEHGAFDCAGLPLGPIELRVDAAGYTSVAVEREVVAGDAPEPLALTLQGGGAIRGVVRADGRPVAGAAIRTLGGRRPRVTASDADGRFELGSLSFGVVHLHVDAGERGTAEIDVAVPRDGVADCTVELETLDAIRGRVVDEHGSGLADLRVVAVADCAHETRSTETTTAADGAFRLRRPCDAPPTLLVQQSPAYPALIVQEDVPPSGDVLFVVGPRERLSARITGRLTNAGDDTGLRVVARKLAGPDTGFEVGAPVDPTGAFDVGPLQAGPYELIVIGSERPRRSLGLVELEPNERHALDAIALTPTGRLRVAVLRADGGPSEGAVVHVSTPLGDLAWSGRYDPENDGPYLEVELAPARYLVASAQQHGARDSAEVSIESGVAQEVSLVLAP